MYSYRLKLQKYMQTGAKTRKGRVKVKSLQLAKNVPVGHNSTAGPNFIIRRCRNTMTYVSERGRG